MQISSSTSGYRNPSVSSLIKIHCFGHFCTQAEHPQQFFLSVILTTYTVDYCPDLADDEMSLIGSAADIQYGEKDGHNADEAHCEESLPSERHRNVQEERKNHRHYRYHGDIHQHISDKM